MANEVRIKLKGDTGEIWTQKNTILLANELGYDQTANRVKFGNGSTPWNDLPYLAPDVVNDLTTGGTDKALSAEQGKTLKTLIDNKPNTPVENSLSSTNTTTALSAAQGKVLNDSKLNSSAVTSETWTFTLSSGSTVTKKVTIMQ